MGLGLLTLELQGRGIQSVWGGLISASYPLVATLRLSFPPMGPGWGRGVREGVRSPACLMGASFNQWELCRGRGHGGGRAGETT